MDDIRGKLWNLALIAFLLVMVAVAYVKMDSYREMVDSKCPWIKEQLAQRGIHLGEPGANADAASATPQSGSSITKTGATPSAGKPKLTGPVDCSRIAADRSLWPKAVKILRNTEFPAVLDGKEVGKISVPAGTEVSVISVQADKIGVAYSPNGQLSNRGGTWINPADTDLISRVQAGR